MLRVIRLIWESLRFAWKALRENILRTTLSLLGVAIGIFAIISVLTVVDSLESSIKKSFSFLGNSVIYVEKWPWVFGPGYPWWKYVNRPYPKLEEYKFLDGKLSWSTAISAFDVTGGQTVKYKSNSLGDVNIMGATYSHTNVAEINMTKGRFFTPQEADRARNVVVIGTTVAEELFKGADPIGREVKIKGIKFLVVGLLEKQGDNLFNARSNDDTCIIPFMTMAKLFASRSRGISPTIALKGYEEDTGLIELENEVRGLLRSYRGIRPKEEDTFALNRPEVVADFFDSITGVLTIAGWCIGSFAILVGGFGIANIMFVSVKERTNLIGIQKSLGAKNYFILLQFLFEAVFLSFLGGASGILLVNLLSFFSTDTFIIRLTLDNILLGMGISTVIGILSGIIPAIFASLLDPVIAIRSK